MARNIGRQFRGRGVPVFHRIEEERGGTKAGFRQRFQSLEEFSARGAIREDQNILAPPVETREDEASEVPGGRGQRERRKEGDTRGQDSELPVILEVHDNGAGKERQGKR